jgi:hypothetical protein
MADYWEERGIEERAEVLRLSTYNLLHRFSKRVKELGGRYLHRYPQAKRTKYYFAVNEKAFEQAAEELGLQLHLRGYGDGSFQYRRGLDIFVLGHTLLGSRKEVLHDRGDQV